MKELQNEDQRILIINNNKTMVTFYSRAIGVLTSKGKYITDLDCDDLFINEVILILLIIQQKREISML